MTVAEFLKTIDVQDEGQKYLFTDARLACKKLGYPPEEVRYLCSEDGGTTWADFWARVGPNIYILADGEIDENTYFGQRVVYVGGGTFFVQSCDEGIHWWAGINAVYIPQVFYYHLGFED